MTNENELKTSGERLKRARILAGITTRREFEEKYKVSANTLQGWEQDKNPLSSKGARRMIEAFKEAGLMCSLDWLMYGKGMPPRPFEMLQTGIREPLRYDKALGELNLKEEEAIYHETQLFKEKNLNPIVITIVDDAMEPFYSPGDYVGGVQIPIGNLEDFLGKACIIELENHQILPRFLYKGRIEGTYTLSSANPKTTSTSVNYYDVKIVNAAPIVWHRRKLTTLK